jgi:type I restriction enzyme S subunit
MTKTADDQEMKSLPVVQSLKPYPEYKDSGVSWLGSVPEHWQERRIKTLFRESEERSGDNGSGLLLSLTRARGLIPQEQASNRIASAEDLSKYKVCRPGYLVMNRMQAWSGMFALSTCDGLVSPDYSVFIANGVLDVKYFEYLFKTPIFVEKFAQQSKGIGTGFNRLYTPEFGAVACVVPPLSEQTAIVRFLDTMDRRIRRYILAKKNLIALLNEQKRVIIQQAVTHGLDSNVLRKPSEVEWLGNIPENWEVRKLWSLFCLQGSGTTPNNDVYYGGGIPWVMTGDLNDCQITVTKRTVTKLALTSIGALRLYPAGSLLVAMYGATIGKSGVLAMEACTNQACCVFAHPLLNTNVKFFQYVVQVARPHLIRLGFGGGQPNINAKVMKSLRVPFPPRFEQDQILNWIQRLSESLNIAIGNANREIALLQEFRTRLIADVVTGKLDVRNAVSWLPIETNDLEQIADMDTLVVSDETDEVADLDTTLEEAEA